MPTSSQLNTVPCLLFRIFSVHVKKMAMMFTTKIYPRSHENHMHGNDKAAKPIRKAFMKGALLNFLLLQLLFLGLFAFIFGALFQQNRHIHNLSVLYIDYDGGLVGQSIREAYKSLEGDTFPTLLEEPASRHPVDGLKEEICKARYWAALYTSPGASARLEAALSDSVSTYNRSDVLTFIWNEARYSATVDSAIAGNLQTLSSTSRVIYSTSNKTIQSLSPSRQASVSVFANPWKLSDINIQPTTQGSRLIYNTLVIILILIQEFFYLGTINGLYAQFKIYTKFCPHRIIIFRNVLSLAYTFVGSLCVTGAIWAFRAGWNVNSNQYGLTWATLWLFAHANFLALDVFTIWLPHSYVPMALITWIVFNVTSILLPFELSAGFYKWTYAMPAHEVYQILTDIWSGGCNPQLYYALPTLFTWEVLGVALSALGVYRRCHYAVLGEEAAERAFNDRIDAAMDHERKRDAELRALKGQDTSEPSLKKEGEGERVEQDIENGEREREEFAKIISRENEKERDLKRTKTCGFGPSFDLTYRQDSDSS